jgi:hypothetical protein
MTPPAGYTEDALTTINGLDKKSIADCLQTRPIDYRLRLSRVRGKLEQDDMRVTYSFLIRSTFYCGHATLANTKLQFWLSRYITEYGMKCGIIGG